MTTLVIDNRAFAKKAHEVYTVDREMYNTVEELKSVAFEMMNSETYKVTMYEDEKILFSILNTVA